MSTQSIIRRMFASDKRKLAENEAEAAVKSTAGESSTDEDLQPQTCPANSTDLDDLPPEVSSLVLFILRKRL